jgi:hypothetical protein
MRYVHLGFGFRSYVGESFQAENISESLDAHDFGRPEFRLGLLPEGVAVDHETNASEALGGEQAVEQCFCEFGLAGAGRHGEQHLAAIGFQSRFDFLDGALLIGPERKAEVERRSLQCRVCGVPVDIKLSLQCLGSWPVDQCAPLIGGFARVAKPDAALGFDLFEIGAAIGREEKRNPKDAPRTAGRLSAPKEKATGITLDLIDRRRNILALALRLDHANTGQPGKRRSRLARFSVGHSGRLKDFRRIATRYDKLAQNFFFGPLFCCHLSLVRTLYDGHRTEVTDASLPRTEYRLSRRSNVSEARCGCRRADRKRLGCRSDTVSVPLPGV